MIVILKRYDLPQEHRHRAAEDLKLEHFPLSSELIEQAELIVFVESAAVKFLKHREDIQSKNSVDVLMNYITSTAPITKERIPFNLKRFGHRREKR